MKDIFQAHHHQLREIELYVQSTMPRLLYHNFNHVMEASAVAQTLATAYHLPVEKRFCLGAAMRLHDLVYVPGATNNEELSAREANRLLSLLGVKSGDIGEVIDIILATKFSEKPKTLLQKLGRDADMHNVGTPYFFEANERVRSEYKPMTDCAWYARTLSTIGDFEFYTAPAQMLFSSMWHRNREELYVKVEAESQKVLVGEN